MNRALFDARLAIRVTPCGVEALVEIETVVRCCNVDIVAGWCWLSSVYVRRCVMFVVCVGGRRRLVHAI
jgi:hypothetical protein